MIASYEEIKGLCPDLDATEAQIKLDLDAIEQAIKGETCNDFLRYADESGEIQWPADIKAGAIELIVWKRGGAGEAARDGIASETISRHSVSYTAQTAAETVAGYPAHLFAFVDPYRRARF